MEDLGDAIESVKNVVARPGTFADFFPETTDDGILLVLMDALAECHLEGLLTENISDENGLVTPEITSGQAALVVLFAGVRFLRAELINRNTSVVYQAGSARYETVQATNILRDILKALAAQKDRIIETGATTGAGSAFYMADQYLARLWDYPASAVTVGW